MKLNNKVNGYMKVYIQPVSEKALGGPSTFLRNLREYILTQDPSLISEDLNDSDILFFPVSFSLPKLLKFKIKGGKVIQRLDGVHYPEHNGFFYWIKNIKMFLIYHFLTDFIIFQSEYSRKQCHKMFGKPFRKISSAIIINGANPVFHRVQPKLSRSGPWQFIISGSFRHSDMITPILLALDKLEQNFTLHVVGPVIDSLKNELNRDYIQHHGSRANKELAGLMSKMDAYFFSAMNSPCPNALIEAVAAGLPVIGFATGASEEIVCFNHELLAYVSDDIFQSQRQMDSEKLLEKIQVFLNEPEPHQKRAVANRTLYGLDAMGDQYLNVFKGI